MPRNLVPGHLSAGVAHRGICPLSVLWFSPGRSGPERCTPSAFYGLALPNLAAFCVTSGCFLACAAPAQILLPGFKSHAPNA